MACKQHESALALYVEGDLPRSRVHKIERHLATCDSCRHTLADLADAQQAWHEAADGHTQDYPFDAFRDRLNTELARQSARETVWRPIRRLVWAPVLAMLLVAVSIGLVSQRADAPSPVSNQMTGSAEPQTVTPEPAPVVAQSEHRAAADQPKLTMMKLYTNNPDVVIYWLVDEPGGNENG